MERPPTLRPAELADLDALTRVLLVAQAAALPRSPRRRSDRSTRYALERSAFAGAESWVAVREEQLAGFVTLADGEIRHLHVDPGMQGRGVGRALVGRAIERSPPGVRVRVAAADERTVGFLLGHGFVVDGEDEGDAGPEVVLLGPGAPTW